MGKCKPFNVSMLTYTIYSIVNTQPRNQMHGFYQLWLQACNFKSNIVTWSLQNATQLKCQEIIPSQKCIDESDVFWNKCVVHHWIRYEYFLNTKINKDGLNSSVISHEGCESYYYCYHYYYFARICFVLVVDKKG